MSNDLCSISSTQKEAATSVIAAFPVTVTQLIPYHMFNTISDEVFVKHGTDPVKRDKVCLVQLTEDGTAQSLTYGELRAYTAQVIRLFGREQVCPGDVVAVFADNSVEHMVAFLACAVHGAICVALDYLGGIHNAEQVLENGRVKLVIVNEPKNLQVFATKTILLSRETEAAAEDEVEDFPSPNTVNALDRGWVLCYTSGTTSGIKKGAVRTQRGSIEGFYNHLCDMYLGKNDVYLAIYPCSGMSTFFFSFFIFYFGGQCILLPRSRAMDGKFIANVIRKHDVTFTTGGPAHFLTIIDQCGPQGQNEVNSLKQILVSGAMTSITTQERIKTYFQNARFFEIYGSSECGLITMLAPDDDAPGSVGKEPPGIERIQFIDPVTGERLSGENRTGEIIVRTPMLFLEYWQRPELTRKSFTSDGYFKTGDIGTRDEKGFIYLQGRADDRITFSTGQSFFPAEVERVILRHVTVSQVLVYVHDEAMDSLTCMVSCNNNAAGTTLEQIETELRDMCNTALPSSIRPCQFWFLSSEKEKLLPRTATGKIKRTMLAAFHADHWSENKQESN